jgi:hypothetical protein
MSATRVLICALVLVGCNRRTALPPSGNNPGVADLAVAPDLGGLDLATRDAARDLAPHDLAPRDLTPPPDLTSPPDLLPALPLPFDGVCTPNAMATSVYDPDCIYLVGTLSQGNCGADVFVYPGAPDDYVAGFACDDPRGMIRPTDGRFLFTTSNGSIDVAYAFTAGGPISNDLPIATPGCPYGVFHVDTFRDGTLAWRCFNTTNVVHIDDGSTMLTTPNGAYAFGPGRAVLAGDGAGLSIVDPSGKTPVTGLPSFVAVAAARSTPDGFYVALGTANTPLSAALYEIAMAGAATKRGDYQLDNSWVRPGCALEPGGAMVCFTNRPSQGLDDTITRFTTTDAPTVIYDESLHPVKIHISYLITGP